MRARNLTASLAKQQHGHRINRERQNEIEKDVSRYIQDSFTFSVFKVPDKDQRLLLESKIISTVSRCPVCKPSTGWLGLSSPKDKIRESGLWLVNELYKEPFSEDKLRLLKKML